MAINFKNFKNGFRVKPLDLTSFNAIAGKQQGDIAYLENTGLRFFDGAAWKAINVEGTEVQNSVISHYLLQKSDSVDPTVELFMDSNQHNYPANDTNAQKQVSNKTIILDLVSSAGDITDVTIHLPQGDTGGISGAVPSGQTVTIYRKDSEKENYSSQGEGKASIRIKTFTSDGATYQSLNICGYTDSLTHSTTTTEIVFDGNSSSGISNTTLLNNKKLVFMFNGTNWILLNSKDQIQELLPVGTVLMSVLTETEFNLETAGNWKICDGTSITGSRLGQITGWTKAPDLVGSEKITLCPSQTSYPTTRIAEPLAGDVNVARGVEVDEANNIIGARIADSTKTDHLGLELSVSSTNSDGDGTYSTATDGEHQHTIMVDADDNNFPDGTNTNNISYTYNKSLALGFGWTNLTNRLVDLNSARTGWDSSNSQHNHSITIPSHTHSIDDADFTKTITGHHAADLTRPYTVLFNFFIRID